MPVLAGAMHRSLCERQGKSMAFPVSRLGFPVAEEILPRMSSGRHSPNLKQGTGGSSGLLPHCNV